MASKVSIDSWRVFVATAEQGSTIKAAEVLHKSQSALSHAIKKMEAELGNKLFDVEGRNLKLTDLGIALLPKAKLLLGEAEYIESLGKRYRAGVYDEIGVAVNTVLPPAIMTEAIERFDLVYPNVSLRVFDTALSGTKQLMTQGRAAIGISTLLPTNLVIEPLINVRKWCVCATDHPLARQENVGLDALKTYQQIVIQDSGAENVDTGWLGSTKRLSISHVDHALPFLLKGLGYSWMPEHAVSDLISAGKLTRVSLENGQQRELSLHICGRTDSLKTNYIKDLYDFIKAAATTYEQNN